MASERRSKSKKKRSRRRSDSGSGSDSEAEARADKKQRKQSAKVLAAFGYTNETNPFGDSNLTQAFVWRKKYEGNNDADAASSSSSESDSDGGRKKRKKKDKKKKKKSTTKPPSARELKANQLARVEEIRLARQRRDARENEREEMERLRQEEMRMRDAEQYEDWQQKEEEFHLTQAKVRSQRRLAQNREKPVDLLAKNLLLVDRSMEEEDEDAFFRQRVRVETRRPHAIIEVLAMYELEELCKDIQSYMELEQSGHGDAGEVSSSVNLEFWRLMMVVTKDRIRRLRRSQRQGTAGSAASQREERGAIHDSVHATITEMLTGKSARELDTLTREVEQTIASAAHTAGIDVEFWEEVQQQIGVYQARHRLTELHDDMLVKLRDLIEQHDEMAQKEQSQRQQQKDDEDEAVRQVAAAGPRPQGRSDESAAAREMESHEASKGLEGTEEKLGRADEVALASDRRMPSWSDKYEPRKPRYFNRVKTGYDWNKYNQTHYDHDNPPPKVVQGYKFNLFFPDLIDKTVAPRFVIEKADSPEFCIIRFTAGPPYQDIAFQIVNREWEYSRKRGFKSVFERGILHLYFNFKRHRYRR